MAPAKSPLRKPLLALLFFFLGAMAVLLTGFYMWGSLLLLALLLWVTCIAISAFACRDLLMARELSVGKCTGFSGLFAVIVIILIGLTVGPTVRTGILLRDQWFLRQLPDFQRTADVIEKTLPFDASGEISEHSIPERAKSPVPRVASGRDSKGVATIVFVTHSGGFPIEHYGYMYRSDDTPWKDSNGFRVRRHIAPNWFALYDF